VQRVKQICGQVFRYAVASGSAERDVTQDLKGALAKHVAGHFAAITEPKQVGDLMRAIFNYQGHPYTVAALKLSPLVFVRPGELRTAEWAEVDLDATTLSRFQGRRWSYCAWCSRLRGMENMFSQVCARVSVQ
jgi:integrase